MLGPSTADGLSRRFRTNEFPANRLPVRDASVGEVGLALDDEASPLVDADIDLLN